MNESEIAQRLRAVSKAGEWPDIIRKCYIHTDLRLRGRTSRGAHSEQRLGMPAHDYYVGNALKGLYEGSRGWDYEKNDIVTQLTHIINSMISNEVRKYKTEQKQNRQIPILIGDIMYVGLEDKTTDDQLDNESYLAQCDKALLIACENNDRYQQLVSLKATGASTSDIANDLQCSVKDIYQMMETIGRRARKILLAEK